MFSFQFKRGQVVVKLYIKPTARVMAGRAVQPKLPVMFIILLMTGVTIGGCALEGIVGVTFLTCNLGVFPVQFERRSIVVDLNRGPAFG